MEKASSKVIRIVVDLILFMGAFTFTITVFGIGAKYNSLLIDKTNQKASSRYTLAYEDEHIYVSPENAFNDVLAGDISVAIKINGVLLNQTVLDKARNADPYAIAALKSSLSYSRLRKEYGYDNNANLIYIDYIGE